jgi:hypothetical protein
MKIQSFGCSFLAGDELSDPTQTWPAIIAQRLGLGHDNHARGGVGNLRICHRVLHHARNSDTIVIVNWTFADRVDLNPGNHRWKTIRPGETIPLNEIYYKHLQSDWQDKLNSLIWVSTAIEYLQDQKIPFLMTYMDHLLFEQRPSDNSHAIRYLQSKISPHLRNFDGDNFLEWSKKKQFLITERNHPMDTAHHAAADHWINQVKDLLKNIASRS